MFREMFPERTLEIEILCLLHGDELIDVPDIVWALKPIPVTIDDINWAKKTLFERNENGD